MRVKTPQEKKALSYAKDRRNAYGENDKASRKNIPLRKAKSHRSYRKKVNDILNETVNLVETEDIEIIENEAKSVKKDIWKKYPDIPLKAHIEGQLNYRERQANKGKTSRKKIREIIENLDIEVSKESENNWIANAKNLSNFSAVGETPEKAVINLKYLAKAAVSNSMGFDVSILVGGKFIKPIL